MKSTRTAFLGGGHMAEAILSGMLEDGVTSTDHMVVADVSADRRDVLARRYAIAVTADNAQAVAGADVVVLAVKPQQVPEAMASVRQVLSAGHLLISICAGIPTAALEAMTPARVVRVMPNLPARVRRGVSAICGGMRATPGDLDGTERMFSAVGLVVRLPENRMNEVTALSGSGPGYVFAFIEAMEAAAVRMDIEPGAARRMAVETVYGAAQMAAATGEDPADLRRRVCSKGGTTLAALEAMETRGFSAAVEAGMKAARDRAAELAG